MWREQMSGRLKKYAFIMQHHSYEGINTRKIIESTVFKGIIVSVGTKDEALNQCNALIDEGVQMIELCSGFSVDDHQHIKKNIKSYVPIARATFDEKDLDYVNAYLE